MFVNMALFAFKLVAGIVGRSGAMIADAVHSASDFATDIVVLAFVRISAKPRDDDHKWGHGKYETLASLLIGVALFGVAVELFMDSAEKIEAVANGETLERPGVIAIVAAAVSIVAKEILYRYTLACARNVDSSMLKANAWHHRSDALSSVATLVGIAGARFLGEQWLILDPIAAIVVGALIIKVAVDMIRPNLDELLERSLPAEVEGEILRIVSSEEGVADPHNLRTRRVGPNIVVDIHIRLDGGMTVCESHEITRRIESHLRDRFGAGTIVTLHVEPLRA
jgi:cation diffusion facilitator family transporter